jgi:transketolase
MKNFNKIVTIEDHLQDGGFGSWLIESIIKDYKSLNFEVINKYLSNNVCGKVGSQKYLNKIGGISDY